MDAEDAAAVAEREALYAWRRRRFLGLGFTRYQAQVLAEQGADWHEASALVAAGCSTELAFDILSG